METIKVAAIQLEAELAQVRANLSKAVALAKEAAEKGAKLVVLPEFFTSAMALSPLMEVVARENQELDVPNQLRKVAERYGCTVAGSYLSIRNGDIYNTMLVQFPGGPQFFHNKDIPTQFENRYYTNGDNHRAKNGIGVALCWEMLRTQTLGQMPSDLRIVAAGSCWWDISSDRPDSSLRAYNHTLNRSTPSRFAEFLGVPVVHAAHVGKVTGFRNANDNSIVSRQLIGTTQIVDGCGKVRKQLEIADGDGILIDEVEPPQDRKVPGVPTGFWTVDLRQEYLDAWNRENQVGQKYYLANRSRMIEGIAI
jgi:predicted amidohydrolase